jgi:sugar lactone lactonase YvrE
MTIKADLLFAARNETGESPVWDEAGQRLWWTDIPARRLHRLDPVTAEYRSFAMPGRVGCFALRRSGGLVIAMEHGFSLFDIETGMIEDIADRRPAWRRIVSTTVAATARGGFSPAR